MTDIVERLRDGEHCTLGCAKLRKEAVAEIEQLRAVSAELCEAMDDCITWLSSGFAPQSQSRALERAAKAKAAYRALEPKP